MTKTQRPNSQQARLHLLNAALTVFYQHSVSRASLQAIAEAAGVTRGALYWHFQGKEDILDALCQLHFASFYDNLTEEKLNNAHALDALRHNLYQVFQRLQDDEAFRQLCVVLELKCEHTESNVLITNLLNKYHDLYQKHVSIALENCIKQGHIPENTPLDFALLYLKCCITGLIRHWLLQPHSFPLLPTSQTIINAALTALCNGTLLPHPTPTLDSKLST